MSGSINYNYADAGAYVDGVLGLTAFPFTVAVWVKSAVTIPTDATAIVSIENGTSGHRIAHRDEDASIGVETRNSSVGTVRLSSNGTTTQNTWNHVGAVYAADQERVVYLDGTNSGSNTTESASFDFDDVLGSAGATFRLGSRQDSSRHFNGLITQVAVWNIALSDAQMASLGAGKKPSEIASANLRGYWPGNTYEDGGNVYLEDFSGNNYDLLLVNAETSADEPAMLEPRKITITDLKAPNAANDTVADATDVQVKLWIDKEDVGAPDVLETAQTITGGVLSVPIPEDSDPTVVHSAVVGTDANVANATSTTLSYAHTGGLLLVAFHMTDDNFESFTAPIDVTATFDGTPMTLVRRQYVGPIQTSVFQIDAAAKTGDLVFTTTTGMIRRAVFPVSLGSDVTVTDSGAYAAIGTTSINNTVSSSEGDLVIQFTQWAASSRVISGHSAGQTQIQVDDDPTRADNSQKAGEATSTTMTTTLDGGTTAVIGIAVSVSGGGYAINAPVLGVAKWTVGGETYFFPIDTTVQEST